MKNKIEINDIQNKLIKNKFMLFLINSLYEQGFISSQEYKLLTEHIRV